MVNASPPSEESEVSQRNLERGLRMVIDQSRVGSATIVAVTLALGSVFVPAAGWRFYLAWWSVVLTGVVVRQLWFERLRRRERAARSQDVLGVTIASAVTGWFAMLCMPIFGPELPEHHVIMLAGLLMAWMVAAVSVLGIVPKVYLAYMVASLVTILWPMWQRFTLAEVGPMMVALPLGVLMMYRLSTGINGLVSETVSLGLSSERLAQQLEHALVDQKAAFDSRSRFLASASHDLKQPVHALSLLVSVLRQTTNAERREQVLYEIEQACRSVDGMFTSLMDMAHIDAGSMKATLTGVDLRQFLKTGLAGYSELCAKKGLQFALRVEDVPVVMADPLLLQRVINNLLDNAVKYTAQGSVSVEALRVNEDIELKIKDTGPGISATEQAGLFLPFARGQEAQAAGIPGLGLGLAVVDHMVKLMNMGLDMQSQPGQGTTFRLRMQRTSPVEEIRMDTHQPPSLTGRVVWLVEDDVHARTAMQLWLEAAGAQVFAFANPVLLQAAEVPRPDLLMADYNLGPGHIKGPALIDWARQQHKGLACVLVTGEGSADLGITQLTLLRKPVSPAALAKAVEESVHDIST